MSVVTNTNNPFHPSYLDARLQQCAQELPEGYKIEIGVELGAGWVNLVGPDGESLEYPCNSEYGLTEQVIDALEYAKAQVTIGLGISPETLTRKEAPHAT